MKIFIYTTTLLFTFALLLFADIAQAQSNNYNRAYRTVNNKTAVDGQAIISDNENIQLLSKQKVSSLDSATISDLDSLLKNRIGVQRIQQGRRSILKLELDQTSKTSLDLLGYVELGNRYPEVGKATPDPKIDGLPTVRKRIDGTIASSAVTEKTSAVTENATASVPSTTSETTNTTVTPRYTSQSYSTSTNYEPKAQPYSTYTASSESTLSQQIGQPKVFRNMKNIALVNNTDKAFFKKYSIVLGSFRNENNADFVRRTFNALGERVIIVKDYSGIYFTLLASYDTETETVQKFDTFSKRYTEGMSRARRISKYGIPLDDMWILVKE